MNSRAGEGAATRIYSPDFERDFAHLPEKVQRHIEKKLDDMGLRVGNYDLYRDVW